MAIDISPKYVLERWTHGWVLSPGAPHLNSVPISAIGEVTGLLKGNCDLFIDSGISNFLRKTMGSEAVMCLVTKMGGAAWSKEIIEHLAGDLNRERAWWNGLDTGNSSAAIFGVLADDRRIASSATFKSSGATPQDAGDLGRCIRLIGLFPAWRARLNEVAAAFPDGAWPDIVENWEALVASAPEEQSRLLHLLSVKSVGDQ